MSDANFSMFMDRYMNGDFVLRYALEDHRDFQEELKWREKKDIMDCVKPPKRAATFSRRFRLFHPTFLRYP
jgi:hypothetical protein